ncbi:hypothetical protein, partial [Salmonella enterica]|uniref:hypothetical protein n=1 Tax=Salmonella enterica TaxID=28901 RepID=UPI0039EBCEAB
VSCVSVTPSSDTSTNDIVAWQNGAKVRKVQTEHDLMYSFTMIETSETVLREYYGNYDGGKVEIRGEELPHRVWVLSVIDGDHVL